MLNLPPRAFLPRRILDAKEIPPFIEKRDRLFALCSPAEQECLIKLACWYGEQCHQLLTKPNVFSDSAAAVLMHRSVPMFYARPSATKRGLAKVGRIIRTMDTFLSNRLERRLIAQLEALRDSEHDAALMGVANFLRALPLELGFDRAIEEQLELVARKCIGSKNGNAQHRIDSLIRSLGAARLGDNTSRLSTQIWPVLLELAEQDIAAGLALIDKHWKSMQAPIILSALYLHESPELAYRLAVLFQPHRPLFASEMMGESVVFSSYQLEKLNATERDALQQIMDESCRLLASWISAHPQDAWAASLHAIECLLQYGNPADAYWTTILSTALDTIQGLDHAAQRQYMRLMAHIAFYSDSGSSQEMESLALFKTCIERDFARPDSTVMGLASTVSTICYALSILEDKPMSGRNRRIAVKPNHSLLRVFAINLQKLLDHSAEHEPRSVLKNAVTLALALSNDILARKFHESLRKQFQQRAAANPSDGAEALKLLVEYLDFNESNDEAYLSLLCQETFDLLIPILESISPGDAAAARLGTGRNPYAAFG